jgi:hypothetical protein
MTPPCHHDSDDITDRLFIAIQSSGDEMYELYYCAINSQMDPWEALVVMNFIDRLLTDVKVSFPVLGRDIINMIEFLTALRKEMHTRADWDPNTSPDWQLREPFEI